MCYKSTLTSTPPFKPTLRAKLNIGETRRVNIWNEEGALIDLPSSFRNSKVVAEVSLRSLWFASNLVGVSLQADNLMICSQEAELVCPFKHMLSKLSEEETMLDEAMLEDR